MNGKERDEPKWRLMMIMMMLLFIFNSLNLNLLFLTIRVTNMFESNQILLEASLQKR